MFYSDFLIDRNGLAVLSGVGSVFWREYKAPVKGIRLVGKILRRIIAKQIDPIPCCKPL